MRILQVVTGHRVRSYKMKYTYEVITDELSQGKIIKRTDADGLIAWIPMDEANSDYQAYLNKDKPQVEHLTDPDKL